jgi:hypothetical protein
MDPYIEGSGLWRDFHESILAYIREALQPVLRPRYAAVTESRLYVVDDDRPVYPDVTILRSGDRSRRPPPGSGTAVLDATDTAAVFEVVREEVQDRYIEIVETGGDRRVVTAIEVLSPENKTAGPGRRSYLTKRDEFWVAGVNLVEIDLLRRGEPTVRVSTERLDTLRPWDHLVAVGRVFPSRQEVYAFRLTQRLPRIAVPVLSGEPDVPLDLQAAFTRCWDTGAYPELLRYDRPPAVPLDNEQSAWCRDRLAAAGFAQSQPSPSSPPANPA